MNDEQKNVKLASYFVSETGLEIPPELQAAWPDPTKVRAQLLSLYAQRTGQGLSYP